MTQIERPSLNSPQSAERGIDPRLGVVVGLLRRLFGRAELDALKREAYELCREVSEAYDMATDGRFSNPNTAAVYIEGAVQDRVDRAVEDAEEPLRDELGCEREENVRLRSLLRRLLDAGPPRNSAGYIALYEEALAELGEKR